MTSKLLRMRAAEERSAGKPIESYPIRLFAHHMAEIWGISVKQFYKEELAGGFTFAENKRIGRKSWSRDRVKRYYDGTLRGLTDVRKAS